MDARLRIVGSSSFSGQAIQVPLGKLLIGRAQGCDVRLNSKFVSAYHCVLLLDDTTLRIRDLGSKNGTIVNGRRIAEDAAILLHDDMVSIGEINMLVALNEGSAWLQAVDSETKISAPQAALEGSGVFAGDTIQAELPVAVPPNARPLPAIPQPAAPQPVPPSSNPYVLPPSTMDKS